MTLTFAGGDIIVSVSSNINLDIILKESLDLSSRVANSGLNLGIDFLRKSIPFISTKVLDGLTNLIVNPYIQDAPPFEITLNQIITALNTMHTLTTETFGLSNILSGILESSNELGLSQEVIFGHINNFFSQLVRNTNTLNLLLEMYNTLSDSAGDTTLVLNNTTNLFGVDLAGLSREEVLERISDRINSYRDHLEDMEDNLIEA